MMMELIIWWLHDTLDWVNDVMMRFSCCDVGGIKR
jgi:hypothetical protein